MFVPFFGVTDTMTSYVPGLLPLIPVVVTPEKTVPETLPQPC